MHSKALLLQMLNAPFIERQGAKTTTLLQTRNAIAWYIHNNTVCMDGAWPTSKG
jgi:hypothetical protein